MVADYLQPQKPEFGFFPFIHDSRHQIHRINTLDPFGSSFNSWNISYRALAQKLINFFSISLTGVKRKTEEEKKFADFKILDDPDNSYSTFCFKYPNLQFDRLSDLGYFNTLLGESAIKDVMAECVKKLRA